MAQSKIQKIRITLTKNNKTEFLDFLQNSGLIQIISIDDFLETNEEKKLSTKSIKTLQKHELNQANAEFTINIISPFAKKKSIFAGPLEIDLNEAKEIYKTFEYKKVFEECKSSEDKIIQNKNHINSLEQKLKIYKNWVDLDIELNEVEGSNETIIKLGSIKTLSFEEFENDLEKLSNLFSLKIINKNIAETNFRIISDNKIKEDILKLLQEYKFQEAELPKTNQNIKQLIEDTENEIKESKRVIKSETKNLKTISKNLDNIKIIHDYSTWEIEKLNAEKECYQTEYSISIYAWIQKKYLNKVQKNLENISREFLIENLELNENEVPPVIIENSRIMRPFEAVTNTYGLPKHSELDPTPYLSVFFILFFALCLTDAGYGILMFITMWAIQKFFKLPSATKKLIRLLMYGGIVTFVIGTLFGGWFGFEAEKMPEFLTNSDNTMFKGQIINAVKSPLTVLILSLALGFVQILLGVFMKLFHNYKHFDKKEALLETGPWTILLTGIGLFILSKAAITNITFSLIASIVLYTGLATIILIKIIESISEALKTSKNNGIINKIINILIKGIIIGFIQGILSLYNLVGYMSDILSYSRLLALGLATAIIGMAVNTIAILMNDMIPYVGWLFMIIIFIGGHIFNLVINALGAFIHSGRLQFVEFFGKFMEGGGDEFKRFSKKSKYIYIKNN